MHDPRMAKLAELLVGYSTSIQAGEKVLIETVDIPPEMVELLMEKVAAAGGIPFVETHQARVRRTLYRTAGAEQFDLICQRDLEFMKHMQAYIGLRGGMNSMEMADVPADKMKLVQAALRPVSDYRVNQTKWVVLRWPTPALAQLAGMSTAAFEDFYFAVCTLDYRRMAKAEEALKQRMEETDRVCILGPGETDVSFSLKGIKARCGCGQRNLPDGEVFSAPVRNSVNGVVQFNTPTVYNGKPFENIRLVFKHGKIVEATGSDNAGLKAILDSDEGARYLGEFSFGLNPLILQPMRDILFDEKIAGSLHLTPGNAYEYTDNGNRSAIHWDMVLIQRPEYGGGDIQFDGDLIRRDGRFVPPDLKGLNPEALV